MIFVAALILFGLLFAVLAWRNLPLALAFLSALLPAYLIRFSLVIPWLGLSLPSTVLELMILIVIAVWVLQNYRHWPRILFPSSFLGLRLPVVAFLLASFAALLFSPSLAAAVGQWRAYFFEPIFLLIIFVHQVRKKEHISGVIFGLAIGVIGLSLVAIIQKFTGWLIPSPWHEESVRRVTSLYPYPNALALYLAPLLVIFGSMLLNAKRFVLGRGQAILLVAALITGFFALVFTQSLGGLLAVIAGLIFALFFGPTKYKKEVVISLAVIVIALAFIFFFNPTLVTFKENSGQVRLALWYGTLKLLIENPIIGSGLAGFPQAYDHYRLARHTELLLYPHNIILNFWVELGLAGLAAFIWVLVEFFKLTLKKATNVLSFSVAAAMVALLVHGLVDVPYFKNDLAVEFWLLVGLAVAAAGLAPHQNLPIAKPPAKLK